MSSRPLISSIVLAAVICVGCTSKTGSSTTVTGPDGTKTTYSNEGHNTTVTAPDGSKTSVTTDPNGTVTYQGKDGSATVGGTITEEDLGVPFYPGSEPLPNASMKSETGGKKTVTATRMSGDDVKKIAAFYEGKLKGMTFTTMEQDGTTSAMGSSKIDGGMTAVITITRPKGETKSQISIVSATDNKPAN